MPFVKACLNEFIHSGFVKENEEACYVVPDLKEIAKCSFYWEKIGHNKAKELSEGKSEGTFLLRDSAQEDYLFSVSVRIKGRIRNVRIEQIKYLYSLGRPTDYSFYSSPTVTGLIKHYNTNPCYRLDGFMLTTPLQRNFPFDLKHSSHAALCNYLIHDSVEMLPLPQTFKMYLTEYHNKQQARLFE